MRCRSCGFENADGLRFCGQCGVTLRPMVEERRLTTILFSDLAGSTPLSFELDPEELRTQVREYQNVCNTAISDHGGYLAKYLGDGVLAYFGYPEAHEDDAVEAVRAGLEIVSEVRALNEKGSADRPRRLRARVGIHTGTVVAGEMGADRRPEALSIVGEAPNIAFRIQETAKAESVVVSEETRQLVSGYFELIDLGPTQLRGVPRPVTIYGVERPLPARTRFDAARQITPFIGRYQELELLLNYWMHAKSGNGQVSLIYGEAGIGKSRLTLAFRERLEGEEYVYLDTRTTPLTQNTPLYPLADMISRACNANVNDPQEVRLEKLRGLLAEIDLLDELENFFLILSLEIQKESPPVFVSSEKQKKLTMEALTNFVLAKAKTYPLLLRVEDLHWADDVTVEFLYSLFTKIADKRILILVSARPEHKLDIPLPPNVHEITLNRMYPDEIKEIARANSGSKELSNELAREIIKRSEGIPLYAEEIAKAAVEQGAEVSTRPGTSRFFIPSTLQGSLMARLDRLGAAKEVAQAASVIGREFNMDQLQALHIFEQNELTDGVQTLLEKGIAYQRVKLPVASYLFKHALIQDSAYGSLLKSKRQELHRIVAEMYLTELPKFGEAPPEIIAYHFQEAGLNEKAVPYWHQAGRKALERSANKDAIAHLSNGLGLLKILPESLGRDKSEFDLLATMGPALISINGYASPEVEKTYLRCSELAEAAAGKEEQFISFFGLWSFYLLRSDLSKSKEFADRCLEVARETGDVGMELEALSALGQTFHYLGNFPEAEKTLRKGISLYDFDKHKDHAFSYGEDPGVGSRVHLSWTLWAMGYQDQAVKISEEAIELARKLTYPSSIAYATVFASELRNQRGEYDLALNYAREVLRISEDQSFPFWAAMAYSRLGYSYFLQHRIQDAIPEIQKGIEEWRATGSRLELSSRLCLLATAYLADGKTERCLELLAEGLNHVNQTEEQFYLSELERINGEALLAIGEEKSGEEHLRLAVDIARKRQAKALELRAGISLCNYLLSTGMKKEARELLLPICSSLVEGSNTKDVQEANALLAKIR